MKLLQYAMLLPMGMMILGSCSDDLSGTDWSPGEPSTAPGVYFASDNETYMALLDGDGSVANLKVKRIDCKGELNVPVVVKNSHQNMVIPTSITFADGSYETILPVDCSTVPAITELPIELTFPDEYINPYAGGAAEYAGQVIVSRWENVSPTGTTDFTVVTWNYVDAGFDAMPCEMYHLLGSSRYRVMDFINSGIDFTFELVKSPYKDNQYRIVPLGNQLLLSDYGWGDLSYYNSWWLVTSDYDPNAVYDEDEEASDEDEDEEGYWPVIELTMPDGRVTEIYYLQFLWYDDAAKSEYCYVLNYDAGNPTAYMAFYGNTDAEMSKYTPYYRLRFHWEEDCSE